MKENGDVTLHPVAGDNSAAVDVVFFHGLGGSHETTWTNNETGLYWPKALNKRMPNVRVWALQYPSAIFHWTKGGATAVCNTKSIADRVRVSIKAHGLMQKSGKPCVWVCHSLGGLVAKHVLLKNNRASEAEGQFDDALLKGIMFLGTPHRGSNKADIGQGFFKGLKSLTSMGEEALKYYLSAMSGMPVIAPPNLSGRIGHLTELIQDLEDRNDGLWSLDKDFSQYFGERWSEGKTLYASVVCEGVAMTLPPMMIVDKKSADPELKITSSGEAVTPLVLPLDHGQLAKPRSADSELFMVLRGLLARVPELHDPLRQLTHGLTGGQQAWHLATRLQRCFARPTRTAVLAALRSSPRLNIDHTLAEDQFVLEVIKQMMGDGSAEACLRGVSFIGAFLNACPNQVSGLVPFCDEVVGWLAMVCGAPSPFDAARKDDADELVYPGFVSDESRINDVFLSIAHAHHKQWPMRSVSGNDTVDGLAMHDIAGLNPGANIITTLERCALGVGANEAESLREYAKAQAELTGSDLTDRELNWLTQHVSYMREDQKGIVLDARRCDVDAHHANALRESVLLPVLTLVQASTDPEGPLQQRLDQAILRYRSNRDKFLASVSASRGTP